MKRFFEGDDDTTALGKRMRSSGYSIGSALGSRYGRFGSMAGGWLGQGLGAGLSRITGNGDYTFHKNSLIQGAVAGNVSFGCGAIRITHREFIQDIYGTTAFQNINFDINPGLSNLFPFLSQLALNFETYTMEGLVFEFKSTSADALNSTNTALGIVGLCVQYNATSPNFVNKQQAEAYEGCVTCNPSQNMICGVECAPGALPLKDLYIRAGGIPNNQDQKTYDMGNLNVFTQGMQASANIGELWAAYDVILRYPKLETESEVQLLWQHFFASTGVSATIYFGTNNTALNTAGTGSFVNNPNGGKVIVFNNQAVSGVYKVTFAIYGSATTIGSNNSTSSLGSAFSTVSNINGTSGTTLITPAGTSSIIQFTQWLLYAAPNPYNATAATITFNINTMVTGPLSSDVWVEQLNPNDVV